MPYLMPHASDGSLRGRLLPRSDQASFADWFAARVVTEDRGFVSPCWIWQLSVTRKGYSRTQVRREGVLHRSGHRLSYAAFVGAIPAGLQIDHLCQVPGCVNPSHLEAVTLLENIRRAGPKVKALGRARRLGECKRGHDLTDPANTWTKARGDRVCRLCRRTLNSEYKRRKALRRAV